VALVSFLRIRLFTVLFALLALGGYANQIYAHAMPAAAEDGAEHQHSDSEEKGNCHHCTCHCSPVITASFDRTDALQAPTFVGYIVARGEKAPKSIPLGIDYPPQLA